MTNQRLKEGETLGEAEAIGFVVLHQGFEARMGPERREVRVTLHPFFVHEALTEGLFQASQRFVCLVEECIGASNVVQDRCFLWVHGKSAVGPLQGEGMVAESVKSAGS